MNERIRQLADEAEAQYCDLGDASCFKRLGLVEAVVFKPEDLEKFAQLIVRKCAQVCRDQPNHYALKADRDNCAIAIEEHFGVEE